MVGNGTLLYDHDQDGRTEDLGGCTAVVRNSDFDTFVLIRYERNTLTVIITLFFYYSFSFKCTFTGVIKSLWDLIHGSFVFLRFL